jgi:hypothetical protein
MTPDKKITAREKNRLHMKTSRLGMSPEKKINMRENASHRMKKLRLNMSPEKRPSGGRQQLTG